MPETVELRIEGNIRIPEFQASAFKSMFESWVAYNEFNFSGSIVPNPDPTGFSLYKVEEVEGLRKQIELLNDSLEEVKKTKLENDALFIQQSKRLEQKEKELKQQIDTYNLLVKKSSQWEIDSKAYHALIESKKQKSPSLINKIISFFNSIRK